ncbi:MAG: hypothetical protein ACRD16_10925, partial [Thermoanaerobaculia bacterium]
MITTASSLKPRKRSVEIVIADAPRCRDARRARVDRSGRPFDQRWLLERRGAFLPLRRALLSP